ncbi:MAG TPA: thioredoxin fold domain-containing protein [Puia sp.]|nr:thioredoxin fold domain-containing protein [Puia sp.]
MKRSLLAFVVFALCQTVSAQKLPNQPATDSANFNAPFMRFPTIPPFRLLKLDSSSYLTKADLRKNRKTIVMFFSPDCEHCKHQTENILADFKDFKDIEIVMATYQPFSEMREFNERYRIYEHPNILIGRDEKFVLPPFYRIQNLPYLALYDKKGKLITTFEGTQKAETLLKAFESKR